jgi:hypothetical protein
MPENTPITDAELAELDRLHSRRGECNKDATKWQQSIGFCYRYLRARLEAAEREKQFYTDATEERRALVRQLDVLINGVEGAAKQAALCDIVAQFPRWLAARDAQQRRERDTAKAEVARQWMTLTEIAELVENYADCDDGEDGIANRPNLAMQVQMLADKATQCNPQAYAWLAARDAQQRREGAALGIEQARWMLAMAESGEEADEMMRQAAKRLREGGK